MKHFALHVTAVGDVNEQSILTLVKFNDAYIDILRRCRDLAKHVQTKAEANSQGLAHIAFWTTEAEWLMLDYDDEAEKLYTAVCDSDEGVLEIPADVYDQKLRHYESTEHGVVRTENDFINFDERGVWFSCAEKHSDATFESHRIDWYKVFDEPKPEEAPA